MAGNDMGTPFELDGRVSQVLQASGAEGKSDGQKWTLDVVGQVKGRDNIMAALTRIFALTTRSCEAVLPSLPSKAMLEASKEGDRSLLASRLQMRCLYPPAAIGQNHTADYAVQAAEFGESIHAGPTGPTQYRIFDRTLLFVAQGANGEPSSDEAFVTRESGLVRSYIDKFESAWRQSIDLALPPRRPIEDREVQVLWLHLRGLPDKVIAQRVDMAPKTIRRDISLLRDSFEVKSRAELAAEATRFEWLWKHRVEPRFR